MNSSGLEAERARFEVEYSKIWGFDLWCRNPVGFERWKKCALRVWRAEDLSEEEYSYIGRYVDSNIEKCWQLWISARTLK